MSYFERSLNSKVGLYGSKGDQIERGKIMRHDFSHLISQTADPVPFLLPNALTRPCFDQWPDDPSPEEAARPLPKHFKSAPQIDWWQPAHVGYAPQNDWLRHRYRRMTENCEYVWSVVIWSIRDQRIIVQAFLTGKPCGALETLCNVMTFRLRPQKPALARAGAVQLSPESERDFHVKCVAVLYTQHIKRARLSCKVRSCTIHPTCKASQVSM